MSHRSHRPGLGPRVLPGPCRSPRVGLLLGCGLFGLLASCGKQSPCPADATLVETVQGNLLVRWCQDAAGLPHGPFRGFELADDPDTAVPREEGTFHRGDADGVFLYRFDRAALAAREPLAADDPPDPIRYRQEYLQGLWHGTWEERDIFGRLVAQQHYDRGRRCGTWLVASGGDQPQQQSYPACEDLPEPDPAETTDLPPSRSSAWNGATCPSGSLVSDEGESWCEEAGVRSGPFLGVYGDYEVVGNYREGLPDGRFVVFFRGRALREWQAQAGRLEGNSRRWHPDGTLAERGTYQDDQRQGTWERWYSSGHLLERQDWDRGLRDGLQRRFVPGGTVVEETTWSKGLREGPARTFYDDGAPECEGTYQGDLRQGLWTCLHPNGRKALEGAYDRGSREGTFRAWTMDGERLFEGTYQGGLAEGTWRFFSESRMEDPEDQGLLVFEGVYLRGEREGWWEQRWERDGVLSAREFFQDDVRHGPSKTYYHNGQVELEGDYVDGQQHGPWRLYYRSGAIHIEAVFFQGVLDGPYVEYAPDGTILRKGRYVNNYFIPDSGF